MKKNANSRSHNEKLNDDSGNQTREEALAVNRSKFRDEVLRCQPFREKHHGITQRFVAVAAAGEWRI
jgi:hypothetical protein